MGSDTQHKILNNAGRQQKYFLLFTALCIAVLFFSNGFQDFYDLNNPIENNLPLDLQPYEKCKSAVPEVKAPESFTTKPIWMAMTPFVLSDSFHKNLINPLTGTFAGGKSFYASIKNRLRHCIGNGQSVTCLSNHPAVEMNKRMPDSLSDKYFSKYILVLRNPMTSIPATYNAKSVKYSGTVGQLKEDEWRDARDKWFEGMLKIWKDTITTWNATKNYDLGMYLVHEDLFNEKKGIGVMMNLRSFLQSAGFDVATEEELKCIWYNAVGEENLKLFHKNQYEYEDYFPGYTADQKETLLKELRQLKEESQKDSELVEILDRYIREIETRLRIDVFPLSSKEVQ